jgi:hypothetical protein
MLLDRFLSTYDFNEVHSVVIQAAPTRVFGALKEVTLHEVPLFRLLFRLRALPANLLGRAPAAFDLRERLIRWATRSGFLLLAELPAYELVFGLVGQPWKLGRSRSPRLVDAEAFLAFTSPGYVKVAANFLLRADVPGRRSVLSTETRVWATDPATRRTFALYWCLVRPGSGAIRREWLGAVKRRAEAQPGAAA